MKPVIIYAIYIALASIITFILYYSDKQKAKKQAYRIPEKSLLLLSFFGGAIGGFAAMQIFRHKTRREHWYFTAVNLVGIVLHIALGVILYIYI